MYSGALHPARFCFCPLLAKNVSERELSWQLPVAAELCQFERIGQSV